MSEEKIRYNSSEISELIKALCLAKKAFKPITKDGKNPFLNTKYVTLDAIINATKDALSDNGLVIMHHQEDEADKIFLVTELIHESGQLKSTRTCMNEYMTVSLNDRGNAKVTPIQVFGATIAYLRRYHIGGLLDIAIDDDVDGNKQGDDKGKDKPKSTIETLTAKYFKVASSNEVERHKWQLENIGKESIKDWNYDDFQKANDILEKKPEEHKPTALETLKANLDCIKTLKELNGKWTKNSKSYESLETKDDIINVYANRKKKLTNEAVANLIGSGITAYNIDQYLETAGESDSADALIKESLVGNQDAIKQLASQISGFLDAQKKADAEKAKQEPAEKGKEPSQEELDLADMEDSRASE